MSRRRWELGKVVCVLWGHGPRTPINLVQGSGAHYKCLHLEIPDQGLHSQQALSTSQNGWGCRAVYWSGSRQSGVQRPPTHQPRKGWAQHLPEVTVLLLHQKIPNTNPSQAHPPQSPLPHCNWIHSLQQYIPIGQVWHDHCCILIPPLTRGVQCIQFRNNTLLNRRHHIYLWLTNICGHHCRNIPTITHVYH